MLRSSTGTADAERTSRELSNDPLHLMVRCCRHSLWSSTTLKGWWPCACFRIMRSLPTLRANLDMCAGWARLIARVLAKARLTRQWQAERRVVHEVKTPRKTPEQVNEDEELEGHGAEEAKAHLHSEGVQNGSCTGAGTLQEALLSRHNVSDSKGTAAPLVLN